MLGPFLGQKACSGMMSFCSEAAAFTFLVLDAMNRGFCHHFSILYLSCTLSCLPCLSWFSHISSIWTGSVYFVAQKGILLSLFCFFFSLGLSIFIFNWFSHVNRFCPSNLLSVDGLQCSACPDRISIILIASVVSDFVNL